MLEILWLPEQLVISQEGECLFLLTLKHHEWSMLRITLLHVKKYELVFITLSLLVIMAGPSGGRKMERQWYDIY
jgi:hypothetical protein